MAKKQKNTKAARAVEIPMSQYEFPAPGYYELRAEPARPDRCVYYLTGRADGNLWFDTRRPTGPQWIPLTWMCVPSPEAVMAKHIEPCTGVVRWFEMSPVLPDGVPPHG